MKTDMRNALATILLCVGLTPLLAPAHAQSSKPIRLIVPFAAGGTSDVLARLVAAPLAIALNQTVIVDNRPGATGSIAIEQLGRAEPDGTTLLFTNVSPTVIAPAMSKRVAANPPPESTAISIVARSPLLIVANPAAKINDMAGLLALAKASPGSLAYSSAGVGSFGHLSTELLSQAAGIRLLHVPYQGQAPSVNAVVSGDVALSLTSPSGTMFDLVRAGKLKIIGMSYLEASKLAPDVVPIAKTVPNFEAQFWFGIVGPPKLSEPTVRRLNEAIRKVLADPALSAQFEKLGSEAASSSPQEFQQLIAAETVRWTKVIKSANLQIAD